MSSKLETIKETSCHCRKCVAMCQRPCWGTPKDIKKIIDAGHSTRLMRDFWSGPTGRDDIYVISPACKGYEGNEAPFDPRKECTFLKHNRCELHKPGLKPTEGRLSICSEDNKGGTWDGVRAEIAAMWDTEEGRVVASEWAAAMGLPEKRVEDTLDFIAGSLGILKTMLDRME